MTTNIATDKLQSQRLLQCGVSADTADMTLRTETGEVNFSRYSLETELKFYGYDDPKSHIEIVPAWSLSAMLELLFKSGHILSMQYEHNEYRLQSFYSSGDFVTYGTTGIEACVNMIEKLVANGYKLNEL